MKLNNDLNKDAIKAYYLEKKDFAVPFLAILISLVLFIIFILPQILDFPVKKGEIDKENEKLAQIENAIELATTGDIAQVNNDLNIASSTLPQSKEFEKILNARGVKQDIIDMENWGKYLKASRCGLGQTAANPILSSLKNFRHLYEEKIQKNKEFDTGFDLNIAIKESSKATGRLSII